MSKISFLLDALTVVCMHMYMYMYIHMYMYVHVHAYGYCKSGNFGQCNIFGKRKKTPFGKKNFSVLRTLDY